MRTLVFLFCAVTGAFGQYGPGSQPRSYSNSPGGYGSIMFPGGAPGHATIPGNITNTSFAGALGANIRGVPFQGAPQGGRSRAVYVPYFVNAGPAYYPYGYAEQPQQQMPQQVLQQQPPVVIINQNYKPDTVNPQLRDYSEADLPQAQPQRQTLKVYENKPRRAAEEDKPTIYLIAMKGGAVMPALAFWVEGDTLNYITRESSHNRISLDRVDKEFSAKLNQERGLEFRIP